MKRQRHQAKPTSTPSKQLKLSNFFSTGSAPKTNEVIIIDSSSGEDEEEESAGLGSARTTLGTRTQQQRIRSAAVENGLLLKTKM